MSPDRRALLLGLGIVAIFIPIYVINISSGEISAAMGWMTSGVKQGWGAGTLASLFIAALFFALWLAANISLGLASFVAFLILERLYFGPPGHGREQIVALCMHSFAILLFLALSFVPVLSGAIPFEPLIKLDGSEIPQEMAPFSAIILAIVTITVISFKGYWVHRLLHRIPMLWRFHRYHHSLYPLSALNSYAHPVELLVQRLSTLLLATLLGYDFPAALLIFSFASVYDRFLHSPLPYNFGSLGWLLVDNRTHFLHHSRHSVDHDCNFGIWTTLWDRLFGTYKKPGSALMTETGLEGQPPPRTLSDFGVQIR